MPCGEATDCQHPSKGEITMTQLGTSGEESDKDPFLVLSSEEKWQGNFKEDGCRPERARNKRRKLKLQGTALLG